MWENITGYIPPVILQCLAAKSHCLLSTWLESSSEVWSSTIWRTEDYWGPSKAFFSFWQYQHSASPLQPGTVLRWTRFLLCFRYCDGCQDLQGLTGEEWKNLWMCVGRKQSKKKKTVGASSTWQDTHRFRWEIFWLSCLQSWTWRKKEQRKKCKLFAQSTEDKLCDTRVLKNLLISCLAFSK